jgi:hypothetical protein
MLPHQQTAQLAPTKSTADVSTAANSALGATKRSGVDLASLAASAQKGDNANTALHVTTLLPVMIPRSSRQAFLVAHWRPPRSKMRITPP